MKTINLILGVHNHQPVGNFDHVMEDAYKRAYLPFLDVLENHPAIPMCIHSTGILLDWYEERHPEYLDRLRTLVGRDQVEVLGGAHYEPILPAIPEADAAGQIQLMSDEVQRHFGARPRGMWMAERVWEPHLPSLMAPLGIEYTALDDAHFECAGLQSGETLGCYITENSGWSVAVFPINQTLRYAIPFHDPEDSIAHLQSLATEDGDRLAVMIDDGEKFGIWPGTHKLCYTENWLDRFFSLLEKNASWIRLLKFGEALDRLSPAGRVYLPAASYREMMQWAMPADSIERYEDFLRWLEENRENFESDRIFIRAGFWRNFLAKYDESNHMHKRMVRISERLHAATARKPQSRRLHGARLALWRAQCNCAYWHGVFGGLYLPHLRSAVYRWLIEAEKLGNEVTRRADRWLDVDKADFDCDGRDELIVESPVHALYFKPSAGASLVEHDLYDHRFNLTDLLGRRKEGYHHKVTELAGGEGETGDGVTAKEEGLERLLHYDWHRRGSFVDHFIAPDTTLEAYSQSRQAEHGDFANQPWSAQIEKREDDVRLTFERAGALHLPGTPVPLRVTKTLTVARDVPRIDAEYRIVNDSDRPVQVRFGVDFALNFLAGDAPDRYYRVDSEKTVPPRLNASGTHESVRRFAIVDEWLGVEARITADERMDLWRFPIETVSISEGGFERVYQGSILFPHTLLDLEPGTPRVLGLRYEILEHPAE